MIFFLSTIHQETRIDCISEGKFIDYEGKQIAILRKSYIDIIGSKKNNGKILFITSTNFFKINISIRSFNFKDNEKSYFAILDKNGNCSLAFFKNSGKIFVSSQKKLKFDNFYNFFKSSIASLNQTFLIYLVSSMGSISFFFSIEKNKLNQPKFSKKSIKIKKSKTICFSVVNLENTSRNIFATIETNYHRPYDKFLIFYEINFYSEKIERKIISKISNTSYLLIPVGNSIKNESLFICSENIVTYVDFKKNKHKNIKIPNSKEKIIRTESSFFSSYANFVGINQIFYIFSDQYGNLFQFFSNIKKDSKYSKQDFKMKYIDSINCSITSMCIFSNGFLFLVTSSGNHLYFQFLTLPSIKNSTENYFFYPSQNLKHLKLIDEITSLAPLLSLEFSGKTRKQNLFMFLICGSNSRSSIRILKNSCNVNINGFIYLRSEPFGLFILKRKNFFSIFITYQYHTSQFFFKKNFVETIENFFIGDQKTIKIDLIKKNRIIQITSKKVRLILNKKSKKKKITEWIPSEGHIVDSCSFFRSEIFHFLLFLSNESCVLICLSKDDFFIELQIMVLKTINFFSLFGVSHKVDNSQKWDFIVLFSREQKLLRVFSLNSENFLALVGIYFLPFFPQSAKIFKKFRETYIIIGLKNGFLLIGKINPKNGKIENFDTLNISDSPIFVSPNPFKNGIILFGSKIWNLRINKNKTINSMRDERADFLEIFQKFIFLSKGKTLKILRIKKNIKKFSKKEKIMINFTPEHIISSNFMKNYKLIFLTFNQKPSNSIFHKFMFNQKKKKRSFNVRKDGIPIQEKLSGIAIFLSYFSNKVKEENNFFLGQLKIRGSNGNKIITGVSSKNHCNENRQIIYLSMIDYEKKSLKNSRLDILTEQDESFYFLGVFSLRKIMNYATQKGGRKCYGKKLFYLLEKFFSSLSDQKPQFFIKNTHIGERNILSKNNFILILELKKKKLENLFICLSSLTKISDIDSKFNYIMVTDTFRGLKIFKFCPISQKFTLISENKIEILIKGCKFLDLSFISIFNKMGYLKFLRINFLKNSKISGTETCSSLIYVVDIQIQLMGIKFDFNGNKPEKLKIFIYSKDGFLGIIFVKKLKSPNFSKESFLFVEKKNKNTGKFLDFSKNANFKVGIDCFLKRIKQRSIEKKKLGEK